MSLLSALNQPSLVVLAGTGLFALLPTAQQLVQSGALSYTALRVANAVAYGVGLYAVSQPGRLDSDLKVQSTYAEREEKKKQIDPLIPPKQERTLVAPSGWAFAIWGPILLGEMILIGSQFLIKDPSSQLVQVITGMTAPYVTAQAFQTLWTASFRPKYMKGGQWWEPFVSGLMLCGTAASLSEAHLATSGLGGWEYAVFALPISIHFGWVTAASLVNFNGAYAMKQELSPKSVAYLGHASAIVATALGVAITVMRQAPVYGSTIAWALAAVSDGMSKRVAHAADSKDDDFDPNRAGLYGASLQAKLSGFGAGLCGLASLAVTALLIRSKLALSW